MRAPSRRTRASAWVGAALATALAPAQAAGEDWRIGPLRVVVAGAVDGALAFGDDGHFNDSDYFSSELNRLRLRTTTALLLDDHVALLGELRSDDLAAPDVYALYLRVRPWKRRAVDLQAGLIPPVFGAFARRTYADDNPLIGFPLGYQYLTSVSAHAIPASADDLARNRGWGSRPRLPYRTGDDVTGLPLVQALRWDTGVQLRMGSRPVQLALAVTQGSLSRPVLRDDNGGRQLSARIGVQTGPAFGFGLSAARGAYLSDDVGALLPGQPPGREFEQTALGVDMEWSRGYWLLRAEGIWSAWEVPAVEAPEITAPLEAWTFSVETRYRVRPGLYAAGRFDRLGFDRVEGSERAFTWDAPVSRLELGVGVDVRHNLTLKAVYQQNWRDLPVYRYEGTPVRGDGIAAAQLSFWF